MATRKTLIKNGKIFDGKKFIEADLLLEGGLVSGMGKYSDSDAFDCDYVFDAEGRIVTAGLVDIHTHMWGVSPDVFGTPAEGAFFSNGVTACVDGGAERGSDEYLSGMIINSAVFVSTTVKDNKVYFDKAEELLSKYKEKALGLKLYFDTTSPNIKDITPLLEVCAYAREKGLKVMVHCNHSPVPMVDIVRALSAGDILTHIYHGGVNTCEDDDYAAFRLAKEKGVILDVGMAGHVHTDFELLKKAVLRGMYPDTISTDITNLSAFMRGGNYGLCLCMSILRNAGVPECDILRMVGENAARAVGKEHEWGTLRIGGRADVAVLEYAEAPYAFAQNENNRTCGTHSYRCVFALCGGHAVYRRY